MKTAAIFWQSQSGNSIACALKAAEVLKAECFEVKLYSMLSKEPAVIPQDCLFVFVYPVFNFKPATATKEFIGRLERESNARKAIAICTFAGMIANTRHIMRQLLKEKNIELAGHLKVKCSESYILLRKYMGFMKKQDGLPDEKSFNAIREFIKRKISDNFRKDFLLYNPLSFWHWLGALSPENSPGRPFSKRRWLKDKCTLCDYCRKLCPSGSITRVMDDLSADTETCVGCCGCFNICPVRAWQLDNYGEKYFLKNPHTAKLLKS